MSGYLLLILRLYSVHDDRLCPVLHEVPDSGSDTLTGTSAVSIGADGRVVDAGRAIVITVVVVGVAVVATSDSSIHNHAVAVVVVIVLQNAATTSAILRHAIREGDGWCRQASDSHVLVPRLLRLQSGGKKGQECLINNSCQSLEGSQRPRVHESDAREKRRSDSLLDSKTRTSAIRSVVSHTRVTGCSKAAALLSLRLLRPLCAVPAAALHEAKLLVTNEL